MSDQPQKYQNIREFLDNLPVVPCAWQPDNPNICNTCLRINDSVARVCSVWSQAHADAPLEEMEFDEEISLMPSIEAIEKDFEEMIETEAVEPVVAEVAAVEPVVAEVAAVEPVVAEVAAVEPVEEEVPEAVEEEVPEAVEEEVPEAVEEEVPEAVDSVSKEPETSKKPWWKFWAKGAKKEDVVKTEEIETEEKDDEIIEPKNDVFQSGFELGEEVVHKVYGKGPIKSLYLSREKWFADVEFYKGVKSILVSFLKRAGEEDEAEEELKEENINQNAEVEEEVVKETPIINTERKAPPIITPRTVPQNEDNTPEMAHAIPVEDIDDIEQDKDPEIEIREKVETKKFSDDNEA